MLTAFPVLSEWKMSNWLVYKPWPQDMICNWLSNENYSCCLPNFDTYLVARLIRNSLHRKGAIYSIPFYSKVGKIPSWPSDLNELKELISHLILSILTDWFAICQSSLVGYLQGMSTLTPCLRSRSPSQESVFSNTFFPSPKYSPIGPIRLSIELRESDMKSCFLRCAIYLLTEFSLNLMPWHF